MQKKLVIIIVALLLIVGIPAHFSPVHAGTTWPTTPALAVQTAGSDYLPASLEASDGTIWLAWQSNALNPLKSQFEIFYRTFAGGVWSAPANITSPFDSANSAEPSLAQLTNGTVILFWNSNSTGTYHVYYERNNGGVWSAPTQATQGTSSECSSSTMQARNGTLWLFWIRGSPCYSGSTNLWYKTLKNGVWSGETQLTFDAALNQEPKVTVTNDGRVWVVWAQFQKAAGDDQIFDMMYNGSVWTPETSLIKSTSWDDHPNLFQDRNGTLWLFWTRELPLINSEFEDKIFSIFSIDNTASWSSPTQMTFDPTGVTTNDWSPSAIQAADHTIWMFYTSSYPQGGPYYIYYLQSSPIFPVHHVIVSQITVSPACPFPKLAPSSPACLYPGGMKTVGESPIVTVSVTVSDIGDFAETVSVQLTAVNATSYPVGSLPGSVSAGGTTTLTFAWNTTRSEKPGRYGLTATVSGVSETPGNLGDNSLLTKNLVHLIPLGDADQDGSVDFIDASTVAYAFQSTPASPRWNPYADFDGDGYVSFLDVSTMAVNFGVKT